MSEKTFLFHAKPHLLDRLTTAEDGLRAMTRSPSELWKTVHDANTVLTLIFATLDGKEWDADTPQIIAEHLADYGLVVRSCEDMDEEE